MSPWLIAGSGVSRTALYYSWLSVGMLCSFLVATVQYVRAEKALDHANEARLHAYLLADELRQSSDDLTRMVRSYVATGNPRFKQHYQEIIDIREGRKPRPLDAASVYWDLVLDDDVRPGGFGAALAFAELIRRAGFTPHELEKLAEAKAASDELTRVEYAAMALVDALPPPSDSERFRAVRRLHDPEYHAAKVRTMRPIAEVHALASQRTLDRVRAATHIANSRRWYAIVLGAGLLLAYVRLLLATNAEKREKATNYGLFRALFDQAGVGLARLSASGCFEDVNQEFCQTMGYASGQLLAPSFRVEQLLLTEDRQFWRTQLEGVAEGKFSGMTIALRCVHFSGRILWVNFSLHALVYGSKTAPPLILSVFDMTANRETAAELENHRAHLEQLVEERTLELEAGNKRLKQEVFAREQAVEALQESEGRFRFLAENSADVIWTIDLQTRNLTYISPSVSTLLGYSPNEILQKPLTASFTPESVKRLDDALHAAVERFNGRVRSDTPQVIEVDQTHRDGRVVHTELVTTLHAGESGSPTSVLGVTRNITQRKAAEEAIRQLAFYDGLTKLPNRRLLHDRLKQAILRARRDGSRLAALFVDLDKFKPVNDVYGHPTGDWLLCHAASRLQACLRDSDTAARIGGDEFVVLLPDLGQIEDAITVAERIRLSIEKPFITDSGETIHVSASIGIATYPEHALTEDELLRLGDEAMYQAKNLGRNQVRMLVAPSRPPESSRMPTANANALIQLTWRTAYASGNSQIDAEHRELFAVANRLFQAALDSGRSREFSNLLASGFTLIERHFAHEEQILRGAGYPQFEQHAAMHRSLLRHCLVLSEKFEADALTLGQLVDFVGVEVVARHVLLADREYFSCLGQRRDGGPNTGV